MMNGYFGMKMPDLKQRTNHRVKGFSLLELLLVVAIVTVLLAFGSFSVVAAVKQAHINDAVQLVQNQLRSVHEQAMDTRSEYVVTFTAPGTVTMQRIQNGVLIAAGKIDLPNDESFLVVPGIPVGPKTPDSFGLGNLAIDFDQGNGGGSNVLYFYPDGTVLDAVGNPNNGVVYVARTGDLGSSRALTIWGATGRVKIWTLVSNAGVSQWR